jgi:hypothetical protein
MKLCEIHTERIVEANKITSLTRKEVEWLLREEGLEVLQGRGRRHAIHARAQGYGRWRGGASKFHVLILVSPISFTFIGIIAAAESSN